MGLTGGLLQVHHESLESKQGLQLLLLITQVLLQQSGPLVDLLGVHLVGVVTWREQQSVFRGGGEGGAQGPAGDTYRRWPTDTHRSSGPGRTGWRRLVLRPRWPEDKSKRSSVSVCLSSSLLLLLLSHLHPVCDPLVAGAVLQEQVQLLAQLRCTQDLLPDLC